MLNRASQEWPGFKRDEPSQDDTRLFHEALRQYRLETGESRKIADLPPIDLSIVLRMAQQLKEKERKIA